MTSKEHRKRVLTFIEGQLTFLRKESVYSDRAALRLIWNDLDILDVWCEEWSEDLEKEEEKEVEDGTK